MSRSETSIEVAENETAAANETSQADVEDEDAPKSTRSSRKRSSHLSKKTIPLMPSPSVKGKSPLASKLRGDQNDRNSQKLDKLEAPLAKSDDLSSIDSMHAIEGAPGSSSMLNKKVPLRSRSRIVDQPTVPVSTKLIAVFPNSRQSKVTLILADRPYRVDAENPSAAARSSPNSMKRSSFKSSESKVNLGKDGNQYYCQVCSGFGDVVCCDGCPRVFHPLCVPANSPSRTSLDNDDDPWFCPECIELNNAKGKNITTKKKGSKPGHKNASNTNTRKSERSFRSENTHDLQSSVERSESTNRSVAKRKRDSQASSEVLRGQEHPDSATKERPHEPSDVPSESQIVQSETKVSNGAPNKEIGDPFSNGDNDHAKKRNRSDSVSNSTAPDHDEIEDDSFERKRKKKRKKSKNKNKTEHQGSEIPSSDTVGGDKHLASHEVEAETISGSLANDLPKAVPAFFFYLSENRWKVERALSRKHRYFNRLPKGVERNELVAKEAALWWVKLRTTDCNRYMNMSMRDFETRIVEWKEEKSLREAAYEEERIANGVEQDLSHDPQVEEDRLTYDKHERLYLSTSVGSKPFKPEDGQSYNRVLLDLLHDTRFHPIPMLCAHRTDTDTAVEDHGPKVTIPYFEVHGPVSTSIGDECLGCSRGWLHFCPVLQRRIPAVESRAKLQPPLSSLLATRIGLGLRPRFDRHEDSSFYFGGDDDDGSRGIFLWRDSDESREPMELTVVPSCTVTDVAERVDDVAQFIEDTTAMKVPEPSQQALNGRGLLRSEGRSLPQITQRDAAGGNSEVESYSFSKCGRCRTIIDNDTGCVQCRRAQLVITKSKHHSLGSSSNAGRSLRGELKTLKVHTAMLGRVKENFSDVQSKNDQKVNEAMLKERWCPSAILPPRVVYTPSTHSCTSQVVHNIDEDDEHDDHDERTIEGTSDDDEEISIPIDTKSTVDDALNPGNSELIRDEGPSSQVDEENNESQPKRLRPFRGTITISSAIEPDRQEILRQCKREADELQKKAVQIACYGILLALIRRDPLHLFALPVTAEGYQAIIQNPIDFSTIRDNVLNCRYSSLGSFTSDARLLCQNALAYNHASSVYYKTAKDMLDVLSVMQRRASNWMSTLKDALSGFLLHKKSSVKRIENLDGFGKCEEKSSDDDPFVELRQRWPQGVRVIEYGDFFRRTIEADFMRTQENETAYYGCLAVCRAAAAAAASLSPYPDSSGIHSVVSKRRHFEDEVLRDHIDELVSRVSDQAQLRNISSWREESVIRLLKKVQSRRLERRTISENGCSRCDGALLDAEKKLALSADSCQGKLRKKGDSDIQRVASSRTSLTTGLGSSNTCRLIVNRKEQSQGLSAEFVNSACVSVRGSRIHGMGLFADQPFEKGDVVAEYIGEYIVNPVADEREKIYRDQRIQDYQFRLNDKLVIDATVKGGWGRYINHNCTPNCYAKIVPFGSQKPNTSELDTEMRAQEEKPAENRTEEDALTNEFCATDDYLFRRVVIVAQRDIEINEELTYDYQFPLELDLSARIPCNCQSEACRGFMNWDLPEKGSFSRALLVQKRGSNMRDRIRRLGRPLKRDDT